MLASIRNSRRPWESTAARVEQARDRGVQQDRTDAAKHAQEAVTWSRDRHMEREAVVEERELLRDALKRSMGKATLTEVRASLNARIRSGEFQRVGPMLTTREMVESRARQHRADAVWTRPLCSNRFRAGGRAHTGTLGAS